MNRHTIVQIMRITGVLLLLLAGAANWFDWLAQPITSVLFIVSLALIVISRILGAFEKKGGSKGE